MRSRCRFRRYRLPDQGLKHSPSLYQGMAAACLMRLHEKGGDKLSYFRSVYSPHRFVENKVGLDHFMASFEKKYGTKEGPGQVQVHFVEMADLKGGIWLLFFGTAEEIRDLVKAEMARQVMES